MYLNQEEKEIGNKVAKIFRDRYKALSAAERSGEDQLLKTDYGLKIVQPDGVSYFLKSNKTKPKLVKKNRGGLIKAGHTDLRKNGLFN